jgi:general secretion pathway protein E
MRDKRADVLVRRLLTMAVEHRASDIHLETLASRVQVRFRIDGLLEHQSGCAPDGASSQHQSAARRRSRH